MLRRRAGNTLSSMKTKALVYRYLEATPETLGPRLVQLGIMLVIFVNVAAVIAETVPVEVEGTQVDLGEKYKLAFSTLELVSIIIFSAEYLLRIWSVTSSASYSHPVLGRLRYATTPMALVDLLSILPFYIALVGWIGSGEGFLAARSVRLVRVFRVFKLGHYSVAMKSMGSALKSKVAELAVTVFAIGILLVLASSVMYYAENEAQPKQFSSIPATMWWGIVTLTTVGYGDMTPVTTLGKIAGTVVAIFGIGLVALPAGIFGSAFVQEVMQQKPQRCPHCGKSLSPTGE